MLQQSLSTVLYYRACACMKQFHLSVRLSKILNTSSRSAEAFTDLDVYIYNTYLIQC